MGPILFTVPVVLSFYSIFHLFLLLFSFLPSFAFGFVCFSFPVKKLTQAPVFQVYFGSGADGFDSY